MDASQIAFRLGLPTLVGIALGLDHELRGLSAGIRTHALVAMSSAGITISALILFHELNGLTNPNPDPRRVIQGLAQAIGFVAAGAIFVSKGDVHNLTSAANIWLAAALGIATGAGQVSLVLMGGGFGIHIITLVRVFERLLPGSDKARRD